MVDEAGLLGSQGAAHKSSESTRDQMARMLAAIRGEIVELRFFGGLTNEEAAGVLKISAETVMRDWRTAKVCLLKTITKAK